MLYNQAMVTMHSLKETVAWDILTQSHRAYGQAGKWFTLTKALERSITVLPLCPHLCLYTPCCYWKPSCIVHWALLPLYRDVCFGSFFRTLAVNSVSDLPIYTLANAKSFVALCIEHCYPCSLLADAKSSVTLCIEHCYPCSLLADAKSFVALSTLPLLTPCWC